MAWEKFGLDRLQPEGDWVQTSALVSVAGVQHRKEDVRAFARCVKTAEKKQLEYGVELKLEPDNPADENAIKVIGFAEVPKLFGQPTFKDWHIGYCDRELAEQLHADLLHQGVEIAAELYSVYLNDDFFDIKFFVLAPPGNGLKRRQKQNAGP